MTDNINQAKQIAIINCHSPFSLPVGRESLDLALIFGAYEQNVSLFFIGDGVFQLKKDQHGEVIESKDFLKTFAALPFYDIENIYICRDSIKNRGIDKTDLLLTNINLLSTSEISAIIHQHKVIYKF